jgi:hypothetical protein
MSDTTAFYRVTRRISEAREGIAEYLAQGGAKSHEEYMKLVGKCEALAEIEAEIKDVEKELLEE